MKFGWSISGSLQRIRPCLALGVPSANGDRALVTIVPHTTSLRGTRYEVSVPAPYLRPGAFDTQGIVTVPMVRLMRQMGTLSGDNTKR
ncbi:MAG: type II toxin-antitoxin system PemK/MazF family toxin [Gammaproteobacteria bacterium]